MKKVSIVVPMYNESEMVSLFLDTVSGIIDSINNYEFEIVAVNDGSKDNTLDLLKKEKENRSNLVIVNLSRNWGHESAVRAGLLTASGNAIIPMDADLQDPPEIIPELIAKWEEGYHVVNAKRSSRKNDTSFKRNTAGIFYRYLTKISPKVRIPNNVANYRLIDRRVLDEVNKLPEKNRVFRVEVPFVGFKTTTVEFIRPNRAKGESKYPLSSMVNLAIDSVTSLSTKPLRISLYVTITLGIFFVVSALAELTLAILNWTNVLFISSLSLWGWLIINILLLLTTIICGCNALNGLYTAAIMEESRNRPTVIIDEVIK